MDNTPAGNAAPASMGNNEEFKAAIDKLEREKRGMYEDMKAEREKRQELENRLANAENEWRTRQNGQPAQDENLKWITDFAQKPREMLKQQFDEYAKPLREQNQFLSSSLAQRDAYEWLAEQENTTVGKIKHNKDLMDGLKRIGEERNLGAMPMLSGTMTAYEFYKMEKKQREENEKTRAANIQGGTTEVVSTPASVGSKKVWKESEIAKMDRDTFANYAKDITLAKAEGRIELDLSRVNDKGRLEYNPNYSK